MDFEGGIPTSEAVAEVIAHNVRQLRQRLGLTLEVLAERAGLSKGTVIQVEQARANPSIATLCRLADALGVGVASLVETATPRVKVRRRGEAVALWRGAEGSQAVFLMGTDPPNVVELWDWTIQPGDGFDGEPHPQGTVELLTVLAGELTLRVGESGEVLTEGDTVLFDAVVAHRYANSSAAPTRFIMSVLQPADAGLGPPTSIAPAAS